MKDWIQTYTGRRFNPLKPDADSLHMLDIAVALSRTYRYRGMTTFPYSVAQHSILVSQHPAVAKANCRLAALLHDASEAYMGDIVRPVKHTGIFEEIRDIENHLQNLIWHRFCGIVTKEQREAIHLADMEVFKAEVPIVFDELHSDWDLDDLETEHVVEIKVTSCRRDQMAFMDVVHRYAWDLEGVNQ